MRKLIVALALLVSTAASADCIPERRVALDADSYQRVGHVNYKQTLPLEDHEVVLTFDDGPSPKYTPAFLAALKSYCVHATFFVLGKNAREFPDVIRREVTEGHSVGSHTMTHPQPFHLVPLPVAELEVSRSIDIIRRVAGRGYVPAFRFPGLDRTIGMESVLRSQHVSVWSVDADSDDWKGYGTARIVYNVLHQLGENQHRGIVLMHDIHPNSAAAVPVLLAELKRAGYRVVHFY